MILRGALPRLSRCVTVVKTKGGYTPQNKYHIILHLIALGLPNFCFKQPMEVHPWTFNNINLIRGRWCGPFGPSHTNILKDMINLTISYYPSVTWCQGSAGSTAPVKRAQSKGANSKKSLNCKVGRSGSNTGRSEDMFVSSM